MQVFWHSLSPAVPAQGAPSPRRHSFSKHTCDEHSLGAVQASKSGLPSQVPSPKHVWQVPGSGPLVTGTHAPVLHSRHSPLQADWQHTPSVQKPLSHSELPPQAAPIVLAKQLPLPSQVCTPGQSSNTGSVVTRSVPAARNVQAPSFPPLTDPKHDSQP